MISRRQVERVAALSSPAGILSAYIRIEPRLMYERRQPLMRFKGAVTSASRRIREARWREALERESEKVSAFLWGWEPQGRGLAIFSCEPERIWEVFPLGVPVPNTVDVGATTKSAVLAQVLDEHPLFVAAIVQRDHARIYFSEQRASAEAAQVLSDVPGQHAQGGWSQPRWERHIEVHFAEHLKKVVDALKRLHRFRPFKQLVIGGTENSVRELIRLFPEDLGRNVIGTFPVDFKHESEAAVLERAYEVLAERERKEEKELVEKVIDGDRSRGKGVVGVEKSLAVILEGRAQTLVVAEGLSIEGSACRDCGYIAASELSSCPMCGRETERADIIERAVDRALLSGARVETVCGDARTRLISAGGIAAVLRY